MEVSNQPSTSVEEGPIKLITIRADLQDHFEVISHEEKTLKCNLVGKDDCKFDGVKGKLTFCERRGWYNFERHLKRVHKISGLKAPNSRKTSARFRKRNNNRPVKNKKSKLLGDSKTTTESNCGDNLEDKWKNLYSNDKYCLMCLGVCLATDKERVADEGHLRRLFPGCEGSTRLSQQLFFIFFLRNMVNFPAKKCEELLKKCKGQRMPDTWFSLCLVCRELVLQAATIKEQLTRLENKMLKIKARVWSKFKENGDSCTNLSRIETEIRKHILDTESANFNFLSGNQHDECRFDDDLPPDYFFDVEGVEPSVKVEMLCDDETSIKTAALESPFSFSGRKYLPRKKRRVEFIDNQEEENQNNFPSTIVKVEQGQEQLHDCEDSETEKILNEGQNLNQDSDHSLSMPPDTDENIHNEDNDFEASASELLEVDNDSESSKDTYHPAKRPLKLKRRNLKKKIVRQKLAKSGTSKGIVPRLKRDLHVCQFCPSKYKSSRSLQLHLEAHEISKTQNNQYDCQHCGYPCHSDKNRELHIRIKHGSIGELQCTLCDNVSSSQKQFARHLQKHREEAEQERVDGKYLCKLCDRLFISFDVLCKHKRNTHYQEIGVDPFRCEHCSMICSTKRLLQDHIQQTHKKQSKYFCELCGKGMLYMSKLRRHMNTHLKEKAFVCCVCSADFYYKETLKEHIKKEHPTNAEGTTTTEGDSGNTSICQNKYTCKQCGIGLTSLALLNRHVRTHAELYANKCGLCGKSYATPQSLRRHKDINHTKRQVSCPFCGKTFLHKEYIRAHYKYCKNYPNSEKKLPSALIGEPLNTYLFPELGAESEKESGLLQTEEASSCVYATKNLFVDPETTTNNSQKLTS